MDYLPLLPVKLIWEYVGCFRFQQEQEELEDVQVLFQVMPCWHSRLKLCNLINPFSALPYLLELDLSRSRAKMINAEVLKAVIQSSVFLEILNLEEVHLGDSVGADVINSITPSHLQSVNLSCNCLGKKSCVALARVLSNNDSSLVRLNLTLNNLGGHEFRKVSNALKTNTTLKSLNLSLNSIEDIGAVRIAQVLKVNSTLTDLNLSLNNLRHCGPKIGKALAKSKLVILNLRHNRLGDRGGIELANALRNNQFLKVLNLENNSLGGSVAKAFESLQYNHTLETLNLYNNKLGDKGVLSLARSVRKSSMKNLNVEANHLLEPEHIRAVFASNKDLRSVTV